MGIALLVVAVAIFAFMSWRWRENRSREILEAWAATSGYVLAEAERRHVRRGPFFLRSSEGHVVFRVVVQDAAGRARSGFIRVGGWWLGLLSDNVAVEWDE